MVLNWAHLLPAATAAFLASMVEFVEALTVVLAVGSVRGWRSSLAGAGTAAATLVGIVAVFGPALTRIPIEAVQFAVGALLLLFGLRWLRKAILRAAGIIPLHDESAAYASQTEGMSKLGPAQSNWDAVAFAASFKITMLEGIEVVFIVIAIGAGGVGLLVPAAAGAAAALALVVGLGIIVHRPLSRVPENALKLIVGTLISAFGTFWVGEGMGIAWTIGDAAIIALAAGYFVAALAGVALCRVLTGQSAARNEVETLQ